METSAGHRIVPGTRDDVCDGFEGVSGKCVLCIVAALCYETTCGMLGHRGVLHGGSITAE